MKDRSIFRLNRLALACLLLQHPVYAFERMSDELMSGVTGQDGLVVQTQADKIVLNNAYWQDTMGRATDPDPVTDASATGGIRRLQANNVVITSGTTGVPLSSKITLNAGSDGINSALLIDILSNPSLLTVDSLKVCLSDGVTCQSTLGALAVQSVGSNQVTLKTTNGLLNSAGTVDLHAIIPDTRFYFTYKTVGSAPGSNQLVARVRADVQATGRMWVDAVDGLRFSTSNTDGTSNVSNAIKLATGAGYAADPEKSGLNIALLQRGNTAYSAANYDVAGAKGIIRLGMSGSLLNSDLYVRGVSSQSLTADSILGFATAPTAAGGAAGGVGATSGSAGKNNQNILGSSGIVMRFKTDLSSNTAVSTDPVADSFSLDIGETGANAYGVRFLNHVAFSDPTKRGSFDTGNIYLNLGVTNSLLMPTNSNLIAPTVAANMLTRANLVTSNDFKHVIQPVGTSGLNPESIIVAVRGLELQSLPTATTFISNRGDITPTAGSWSLATPVYGVNANLALYSDSTGPVSGNTSERIGFGLGVSTTGIDTTGTKTTSVLLVDSGKRYVGLRNIDSLITAQGSLEVLSDSLRINLPNFLVAISGQVAVGYLPNRTIGSGSTLESATNFSDPKDQLFGLNVKLQGAADSKTNNLEVITAGSTADTNYLGFKGDLTLVNSSIQFVDPINSANPNNADSTKPLGGSKMGFDNISGRIRLDLGCMDLTGPAVSGCLGTYRPAPTTSSVSLQGHFTINPVPGVDPDAGVLKSVVNFYTAPTASSVNPIPLPLAQMVVTGGKLYSNVVLSPR